jgi:hypothetical protein
MYLEHTTGQEPDLGGALGANAEQMRHLLDQPEGPETTVAPSTEVAPSDRGMQRKLEAVTKTYSDVLVPGEYELLPLGSGDFMVRFNNEPVEPGNDWVTFDLDDTLIDYTGAKQIRSDAYGNYLEDGGIAMSEGDRDRILDMTDKFARWDENGAKTYHVAAHLRAADWATKSLADAPPSQRQEVIGRIQQNFGRRRD